MFIKNGDGKIVDVIKESDLTDDQKKMVKEKKKNAVDINTDKEPSVN